MLGIKIGQGAMSMVEHLPSMLKDPGSGPSMKTKDILEYKATSYQDVAFLANNSVINSAKAKLPRKSLKS